MSAPERFEFAQRFQSLGLVADALGRPVFETARPLPPEPPEEEDEDATPEQKCVNRCFRAFDRMMTICGQVHEEGGDSEACALSAQMALRSCLAACRGED